MKAGQPTDVPETPSGRGAESDSRNGLIDGWRGVSVSFVIIGHLVDFRYASALGAIPFRAFFADPHWSAAALAQQVVLRLLAALPSLGVNIFFLISGYLITALLIKEISERGCVSLVAFYVRRGFRILPAFSVHLLALAALAGLGVIAVAPSRFAQSACFLCDFDEHYCSWWLGHTWTLGVEEQFYLIWPALFLVLRSQRNFGVAVAVGLLVAVSIFHPLALAFAHIAMGALCALSNPVRAQLTALGGSRVTIASVAVLLSPPFFASNHMMTGLAGAPSPVLLGSIFFAALDGRGPFCALVRSQALRRIGLVSYSLYLWQQLFLGDAALYENVAWLRVPVLFVAPALVSCFAIERPFIALGRRLSRALQTRPRRRPQAYEAEHVQT